MYPSRKHYGLAASSLCLFLLAQGFQELAYRFWIPKSRSPQDDLLTYLLPIDRLRALLMLGTILGLVIPFVMIALRYATTAPVASLVGLIFAVAFIGFECSHRSLDFFLVGSKWAHQFVNATPAERIAILDRFERWNEISQAWYFPLLLSYLVSSASFLAATWTDAWRGRGSYLAPLAFSLNVLRITGRLLSNFAGQKWLAGVNESLYFPAVLMVYRPLVIWFLFLARSEAQPKP